MLSAAVEPEVVVRSRSVPAPLPSAVVPVRFVRLTPPVPEPATVMSSKTLPAPMLVPLASRPLAPVVVTEIGPGRREVHRARVVDPHPDRRARWAGGRRVVDGQVGDVERARGGVELEPGLGAGGAGVDDVDVVDGAAAGVAARARDTAPGALGVDPQPAHLGAVVEVHDVGVVVGDRSACLAASAACRVSVPTVRVAASPIRLLAGLEVEAGRVAARGVVAVVDEDRVVGRRGGLRLGQGVERLRGRAVVAPVSSLLTYHDAAGDRDRHPAGVGLVAARVVVVEGVVEEVAGVGAAGAGGRLEDEVTVRLDGDAPSVVGGDRARGHGQAGQWRVEVGVTGEDVRADRLVRAVGDRQVSVGSGVAGAPSVGSLPTRLVLPTALSVPVNVSSSATGASFTQVTVIETVAESPPLSV